MKEESLISSNNNDRNKKSFRKFPVDLNLWSNVMVTVAVDVGFFLFRCCCSKESSVALCMKLSSPKSNNYLNDKWINIHNSFGYSKLQIFVLSFSEYINHEPFGRLIILFIFRFFSFFIISVVTEQSCL